MFASVFRSAVAPAPSNNEPPSPSTRWLIKSHREKVPECCRRQAKAPPIKTTSTLFNLYDGISYRFVDGTVQRRLSSTVGGQRVPFEVAQVQSLRRKRDFLTGLSSIEEEKLAMCESCHSNSYSRLSNTKCITLTSAPKTRKTPTKATYIVEKIVPLQTESVPAGADVTCA
ncbi:hypothetical protein DYB37_003224 [Aphanomyces astaci]|uniref:Uncharacterized protein n=1 Tax=Aphanomyces astaci TaxID=112090 RepID=A0A3R7B573_APHAT|nr:hypothetical protein DYB35_000457 [Aphanomyces astaci]RHZ03691.1 hypothetical protein DYB37_003224 [Aphanomyces astaci]